VDEDPAWILSETEAGPLHRRVTESLFTLGAGGVAARGSVEEAVPGAQPMVLVAGVYDGTGSGQHLLPGPVWTGLAVQAAPVDDRRMLDLRTGVLERTGGGNWPGGSSMGTTRHPGGTHPGCSVSRPGHEPVSEQRLAIGGRDHAGPARRPGRRTGSERGLDSGGDELRGLRIDGDVPAEQHAADDQPGVRGRVARAGGGG